MVVEFGGELFRVAKAGGSSEESLNGPVGGRFSLGGLRYPKGDEDGDGEGNATTSSYCVGVVVESDMGTRGGWKGSGMKNTWVLGEPFFRGLGVVFDIAGQRVGFRDY